MLLHRAVRYTLVILLLLAGIGLLNFLQAGAGYLPLASEVQGYRSGSDGEYIVFTRLAGTQSNLFNLYSVSTRSGIVSRLNRYPLASAYDFWLTPNGQEVVFIEVDDNGSHMVKVPIQGGSGFTIAEEINIHPAFDTSLLTPDGQYAIYTAIMTAEPTSTWGLFSVSLTGGSVIRLDPPNLSNTPIHATVSPDGRWVAFGVPETTTFVEQHFYIASVMGGPLTEVNPEGTSGTGDFVFTPDSQRLVFEAITNEGGPSDRSLSRLYVIEPTGENLTLLQDSVSDLAFKITPDTNQVIYSYAINSDFTGNKIYQVPATGGVPILLHEDILYEATYLRQVTNTYALLTVRDTSEKQNLRTYLDSLPLGAPAPRIRLTQDLGVEGWQNVLISELSPDGNTLVYSPIRSAGIPLTPYSVPLDGTMPPVQLAFTDTVSAWTFDAESQYLYLGIQDSDLLSVTQVPLSGGASHLLYQTEDPTKRVSLYSFELPDNRVVFSLQLDNSILKEIFIASDSASALQFAKAGSITEEISGTYTTTVTLDAASLTTITAEIDVVGGTATEGEDYTFTPLTVTFAPGEMSASVPITLLEDDEDEPTETLILELSNIEGGVAGTPLTQTITIAETVYRQWMPITSHQR